MWVLDISVPFIVDPSLFDMFAEWKAPICATRETHSCRYHPLFINNSISRLSSEGGTSMKVNFSILEHIYE
jgi:hypothetical protein